MFALILPIEYVDTNLEYTMVFFLNPFHMIGILKCYKRNSTRTYDVFK